MHEAGTRIGIDLGGTKIEVIALDPSGAELFRSRVATPRDYSGTLGAIALLVAQTDEQTGDHGRVGIGIPGTISPVTGLVKNANSTWLIGHPLDRDLADLLGRPVRVMNDANCFALSEATDGAGRDAKVVFGVILGTGVGGGIVVDRQVLDGAQRICGEWGHNALPRPTDRERPGPPCYCGRHGCIETFLSGPGMQRDHAAVAGVAISTHEIVTRAHARSVRRATGARARHGDQRPGPRRGGVGWRHVAAARPCRQGSDGDPAARLHG
jgi:fructokinase